MKIPFHFTGLLTAGICLYCSMLSITQASVSVIDDKGRTVTLAQPANRIISLAPHITESLFEAGAGDKLVGVVAYSDYPEAAKKITRVGGYPTADIEKIISLKPDLVISWPSGNNFSQIDKLTAFGIPVFMSEPHQPQDIAVNIKKMGILAGTTDISEESAEKFLQHHELLKKKYSNKKKVKVFYQFWNKPIMTVNGKHLISNIMSLCGGENVFANLHSLIPKVSVEAVIASNTQVILAGSKDDRKVQWKNEWKQWTQLEAVKKNQIYFIDPDLLNRVGPRVLNGADKVCAILDKVRDKAGTNRTK